MAESGEESNVVKEGAKEDVDVVQGIFPISETTEDKNDTTMADISGDGSEKSEGPLVEDTPSGTKVGQGDSEDNATGSNGDNGGRELRTDGGSMAIENDKNENIPTKAVMEPVKSTEEKPSVDDNQIDNSVDTETTKEVDVRKEKIEPDIPLPPSNCVISDSRRLLSKPKDYAKVIRVHEATKEDQLSLHVGNVVVVLSKEVQDSNDMWYGELNGKRGAFPSQCVCEITTEEAEKVKWKLNAPPPLPAKPTKLRSVPAAVSAPSESPEPVEAPAVATAAPTSPHPVTKPAEGGVVDRGGPVSPSQTPPAKRNEKLRSKMNPKALLSGLFRRDKSPAKVDEKLAVAASTPEINLADAEIANEADQLSHLTAQRPRNPNKRPPSQTFLREMSTTQSNESSVSDSGSQTGQRTAPPMLVNKPFRLPPREGARIPDHLKAAFVPREEFDQLKSSLEQFRHDAIERIRELEKKISPDK